MIEKEVQKVTTKMSQTIEFTQRLLKHASPTEVIVFKPLLDSRLQGFLTFNADPAGLRDACEIRSCAPDLQQARHTIHRLVNQLRSDSWLQSGGGAVSSALPPSRASPLAFPGGGGDFFDSGGTASGGGRMSNMHGASDALASFGMFGAGTAAALATSAPSGTTNGFSGGLHADSKVRDPRAYPEKDFSCVAKSH